MLADNIETRVEFAKILQFVSRSITGEKLCEEVLESYWFVLQDEFNSIKELVDVAKRLLKSWSYSYMPKPAQFIEALADDDLELIAQKAYKKAKETAIAYGVYENLKFSDPYIAETILTLFRDFKEFHDHVAYINSDDTWIKKDFIKTYVRLSKNGQVTDKKLVGYLQESFTNPIKIKCNYNIPKIKNINSQLQINQKVKNYINQSLSLKRSEYAIARA